jgi:hypothetical protein
MILKMVAHNAVHFPADLFAVFHVHLKPTYPKGPLITSTLLRIIQGKSKFTAALEQTGQALGIPEG